MNNGSHQQIELRAYELWTNRGQPWGEPEIDWFRAENELNGAEAEGALSKMAREVGSVVGKVVSTLSN